MLSLQKRRFFALQCSLLLSLLTISVLLVACSSGPATTNAQVSPTPTFSLQMGRDANLAPTPTPLAYTCGAWISQNTLPYAKFTKMMNGNPQGIDGATAIATVHWPDGENITYNAQTTLDGLAVFTVSVANHPEAVNKITLITIHFEKAGVEPCEVDTNRPAFFSLIIPSSAATQNKGTPVAKGTPKNH